jgi:hypothetical protein
MVNVVAAGTPTQVAPLLGTTDADLVSALREAGFTAAEAGKPLSQIATDSGKNTMELMATLSAQKAK